METSQIPSFIFLSAVEWTQLHITWFFLTFFVSYVLFVITIWLLLLPKRVLRRINLASLGLIVSVWVVDDRLLYSFLYNLIPPHSVREVYLLNVWCCFSLLFWLGSFSNSTDEHSIMNHFNWYGICFLLFVVDIHREFLI